MSEHAAALVEAVVVVVGYTALAVVVTWPLSAHLGSALPGVFPNDGAGSVGWLSELHHEHGYRLLGPVQHSLTGAPIGWTEGSALNYQWLLPYYPAYLAAGLVGDVAALNLAALLGLALSGASMYLLVRYLGCGRLVAAWSGLVYLMFPWHLERVMAGHASLVHLEVFPLLLLACMAWMRKPSDGRAGLVALVVLGSWMTSGYYGAMAVLVVGTVAGLGLLVHRRTGGWRGAVRSSFKMCAISATAVGAVLLTAVWVGGTEGIAVGRDTSELELYGAHLRDFLPSSASSLLGSLSRAIDDPTVGSYFPGAENVLYPGLLTLALALGWVVFLAVRRAMVAVATRTDSWTLIAVGAVALVFSTPNPARVGSLSLEPMPSAIAMAIIPSFRVPSRLVVLVMVALIGLAALGLSRALASLGRRRPAMGTAVGVTVVALACALSVAEFRIPFRTVEPTEPAQYLALARAPAGILAEYPLGRATTPSNSEYLYWQREHGRRLLNGATLHTDADAVRRMLVDPAARGTASMLALLGVSTIVTRPTTLDWRDATDPVDRRDYGPGYTLLADTGDGVRLWKVDARPAPAVAAYGADDVLEPFLYEPLGGPAFQTAGGTVRLDLNAKAPALVRLRMSSSVRRGAGSVTVTGRSGRASFRLGEPGWTTIPVRIPSGRSALVLTIDRDAPGADPLDVWLSGVSFERARPGDGRRAVKPILLSSKAWG